MSHKRLICGNSPGCNADYYMITGMAGQVWDKFGGEIKSGFLVDLEKRCNLFKKQDKVLILEFFNALQFRETAADQRKSGGEGYVWNTPQFATRKDAFFSPEGFAMQREAIEKSIKIAKKSGCEFLISVMWEAQTLSKEWRFKQWLSQIKDVVHRAGYEIGVHSNIVSHYEIADFIVYEGNYAKHLGLLGLKKDVICLRRNRGRFNPKNKTSNFKDPTEKILIDMELEILKEYIVNGSTAEPFPRYIDQRVLNREVPGNKFDCNWFRGKIREFIMNISKEGEKYQGKELPQDFGLGFVYGYKKPEPDPEPEEKPGPEENKKTAPIVPVEREEKMSNFIWKNIWDGIKSWFRKNWLKIGIPFVLGLILGWIVG